MSDPRLTVIMPLKHYHESFLRESLHSVLHQTCSSWRLLIVVERTDLDTFTTLLHDEIKDPRFKIITNGGYRLAGAVNSALRSATTDFVALLLADDLWSTDAVKILNEHIGRYPKVDFFHSSRRYIDETGSFISSVYPGKDNLQFEDFKYGPVKHLLCWRRNKALSIGGLDESLSSLVGVDDYDFPWSMAEHGAKFHTIPDCLYYYREHCECYRLTSDTPMTVFLREVSRILKKHRIGIGGRILRLIQLWFDSRIGSPYLYRSNLDKWIVNRLGHDVRRRWKPIPFK